jgi:hypothetical protein
MRAPVPPAEGASVTRRPLTLRRALRAALELVDILRDVARLARMLPQVTT